MLNRLGRIFIVRKQARTGKPAPIKKSRDKAVVSKTMSAVKGADTAPEVLLRKTLWRMGLRYRLHVKTLPGKPDIVLAKSRVAVFVDGDFWHGRQWRLRGHKSLESQFNGVSNKSYWVEKITRNMARDREVGAQLRKLGWRVVRIWESDLRADVEKAGRFILKQTTR